MACDAQTLINAACEGGYDGLQDRQLQEAIAYLLCTTGAGAGGQILEYTADPVAEGVVPTDQNSPALCYPEGGVGPTWTWNTTTHVWQ